MTEEIIPKRGRVMRGAMEAAGCGSWAPVVPPAGDSKQRERRENIDSDNNATSGADSDASAARKK